MKEEFLHYVWRYGLYHEDSLETMSGQRITVVKPGYYNRDSGPDFRQARIIIGQAEWIGDVEIHVRAADWYAHQHHQDPAYNAVILHVVLAPDRTVKTQAGFEIPTIRLSVKSGYYDNYLRLVQTVDPIPCHQSWQKTEGIFVDQAIIAMGVDRMESRFQWLSRKLAENKGGWKDLFFQVLARAFGFGKYQDNFEKVATSIPIQVVERHKSNLFQLESLFFGQAGLLPERSVEAYPAALVAEYKYLRNKYRLTRDPTIRWSHRRTRPANSPTLRMAQLAAWFYDQEHFFEQVLNVYDQPAAYQFEALVSSYWKSHHDFGSPGNQETPKIGASASDLILINAVLPLGSFYRQQHTGIATPEEWMEKLEMIRAESNQVITRWKDSGLRVPNALYSQSLLHMFKHFCIDKKCLDCRLGQVLLRV